VALSHPIRDVRAGHQHQSDYDRHPHARRIANRQMRIQRRHQSRHRPPSPDARLLRPCSVLVLAVVAWRQKRHAIGVRDADGDRRARGGKLAKAVVREHRQVRLAGSMKPYGRCTVRAATRRITVSGTLISGTYAPRRTATPRWRRTRSGLTATAPICLRRIVMSIWSRGSDAKIRREARRPQGGTRDEQTGEPNRGHARRSR
jgi:hypothetical protein